MGITTNGFIAGANNFGAGIQQGIATQEARAATIAKLQQAQAQLQDLINYHQGQLKNGQDRNQTTLDKAFGNGVVPGTNQIANNRVVNQNTYQTGINPDGTQLTDAGGFPVMGRLAQGQAKVGQGQQRVDQGQSRLLIDALSGLGKNAGFLAANGQNPYVGSLLDKMTGTTGVPAGGVQFNPSALDAARTANLTATTGKTQAETPIVGPLANSLIGERDSQTALNKLNLTYIPKTFDLKKYTAQQQIAIRQQALALQKQGLDIESAYKQAMVGIAAQKSNIAGYRATHPNTGGSGMGLLPNGLTQQVDNSLAQESLANETQAARLRMLVDHGTPEIGSDGKATGKNIPLPLDVRGQTVHRIKALQNRNAEINNRRFPTNLLPPPPRGANPPPAASLGNLPPMPITANGYHLAPLPGMAPPTAGNSYYRGTPPPAPRRPAHSSGLVPLPTGGYGDPKDVPYFQKIYDADHPKNNRRSTRGKKLDFSKFMP